MEASAGISVSPVLPKLVSALTGRTASRTQQCGAKSKATVKAVPASNDAFMTESEVRNNLHQAWLHAAYAQHPTVNVGMSNGHS